MRPKRRPSIDLGAIPMTHSPRAVDSAGRQTFKGVEVGVSTRRSTVNSRLSRRHPERPKEMERNLPTKRRSDIMEASSKRRKSDEPQPRNISEVHGLAEAKNDFRWRGVLPDFIHAGPPHLRKAGLHKLVEVRPKGGAEKRNTEMLFEFWDSQRKRGFWTLQGTSGKHFIMKWSNAERGYVLWQGLKEGWTDTAIAFSRKATREDTINGGGHEHLSNDDGGSILVESPETPSRHETSDDDWDPGSEQRHDSTLSPVVISDTSDAETPKLSPIKPRRTATTSYPRTPSKSVSPALESEQKSQIQPQPQPMNESLFESPYANATLIFFTKGTTSTTRIPLDSCPSSDVFYEILPHMVGMKLEDVREVTVTFGWIADPTMNSMRLLQDFPGTFQMMLKEVREAAPGLKVRGESMNLLVKVGRWGWEYVAEG